MFTYLKMFLTFRLCRSLQILSEMFLSIFQNDSLVTRLHPLQTTSSSPRIKPSSLLSSLHFPLTRDGAKAGCSKVRTHSSTVQIMPSQVQRVKMKKMNIFLFIKGYDALHCTCSLFLVALSDVMLHI